MACQVCSLLPTKAHSRSQKAPSLFSNPALRPFSAIISRLQQQDSGLFIIVIIGTGTMEKGPESSWSYFDQFCRTHVKSSICILIWLAMLHKTISNGKIIHYSHFNQAHFVMPSKYFLCDSQSGYNHNLVNTVSKTVTTLNKYDISSKLQVQELQSQFPGNGLVLLYHLTFSDAHVNNF